MIARRTILIAVMAVALPALGQDKTAPRLGIKGYDPVSYFTEGRPVKGAPGLHHDFDDRRYLFSSQKNRGAFAADPARYEPQFGGLCATGIAFGKQAESDPTQWAILDGRLYVFSSLEAKQMAEKDPGLIRRAHRGGAAK